MLLLLVTLFAVVLGQSMIVRPQQANGIDFIDLSNPALSNIANLNYNAHSPSGNGAGALWLTADKSNPNLWLSRINSSTTYPNDWWFELNKIWAAGTLPPFIAFDSIGDNLFGISLPAAAQPTDAYDTALQAVSFSGQAGKPGQLPKNYPGYSFYSIVMGQNKVNNHYYAYVVGWADDQATGTSGLFIGRVTTTPGTNPSFTFDPPDDVRANVTNPNQACYDLFTTIKKPAMFLDDNFLYVVVTGRCAFIIKLTLPGALGKFSSAKIETADPASGVDEYLSSAARDAGANMLYIAIQNYDRRFPSKLMSFNLATMQPANAPIFPLDTKGQANTFLAFGIDGNERNLYAFSSGSSEAYRFTTDVAGTMNLAGIATLPENFRTLGSVIVIGHYVYFSTYRNDAVIARMSKTGSFCKTYCGVIGFCDLGQCSCQAPYKKVYAPNGTLTCENPKIYDVITREVANEKAAVAFGVFFAFAFVAALAGWFLWWRGKASTYQQL